MKKFTPVDFPRFVNFEFVISFLLRTLAYSIVLFFFQKRFIVPVEIMIFICYTHFVIEIITKYVYVFLSCRRKCDQKSMKEVVRCPLLSFKS